MYPQRELIRLEAHKAVLRRRIGRQRTRCVSAVTQILQPVAWIDRLRSLAHRLSPFVALVAIPLGLLLKRSTAPRPRLLGTLLRWGPLVLGAVRGLTAGRRQ